MGEAPTRVQLSRQKGWRMPPGAVKVDRSTRWGNPYSIGAPGPGGREAPDAEGAVGFFRMMLRDPEMRAEAGYPADLSPLRNKDLACWCAGPWCHADVLIEVVNAHRRQAEGMM
jgi:hypothetical protein